MVTTAVSIQTVTGAMNYKSIRVYKWRHAFLFCYPFSHISLLMHLCTHTHAPHRHIYIYIYIHVCIYIYIWYLYRYISWNSSCDIHGSNTLLGWGWYLFIQQSEAGWGALERGAPRGLFAPRTRATFWLRSMSHSAPEADLSYQKQGLESQFRVLLSEMNRKVWYDYS